MSEDETWILREANVDRESLGRSESLFALANGHIGLRGTLDEGEPRVLSGTYLNGFYESFPLEYGERGYGFAEDGQAVVDVPDGKIVRLMVENEPVDFERGFVHGHERTLDLRSGLLERQLDWSSSYGDRIRLRTKRLVSFVQRSVAAVVVEVEAVDRPLRVAVVDQPAQVVGQQGGERRVDLGRRRPLVLAEGPDGLVRQRDVDAGQLACQGRAERALVLGVAVAVQQADGDRLGLERAQALQHVCDPVLGELAQRPVRGHPLGRAHPALRWDQRRGVRGAQPVQVGAGLAPELDHVREALGRDERRACAAALQQRVRGHRRAVGERLDAGCLRVGPLERGADGGQHALALVVRRRRRLGRDQPPADREDGVREGASDVDAQQHCGRTLPIATRRSVGARAPPARAGAGATGSSRCAAAASAGTACPYAWSPGTRAGCRAGRSLSPAAR
jgi:hypothetical protein